MLKLVLPENISFGKYKRVKSPTKKIVYLFALMSKQQRFQENEDTLVGVLDMVGGLEYHLKKIKRYEKSAYKRVLELEALRKRKGPAKLSPTSHHLASHEAVAYINRIGQLVYFFKSDWFNKIVPEEVVAAKISSCLALQPFRNKFTAHRQIDYPAKDDCPSLGLNQHKLLHGLSYPIGKLKEVRIDYQFPTKQRDSLLKKHHIPAVRGIEHFEDSNNLVTFRPTEIHSVIVKEVIELLEIFFIFPLQMQRAGTSVPLNIAEGAGEDAISKNFSRCLGIALPRELFAVVPPKLPGLML